MAKLKKTLIKFQYTKDRKSRIQRNWKMKIPRCIHQGDQAQPVGDQAQPVGDEDEPVGDQVKPVGDQVHPVVVASTRQNTQWVS